VLGIVVRPSTYLPGAYPPPRVGNSRHNLLELVKTSPRGERILSDYQGMGLVLGLLFRTRVAASTSMGPKPAILRTSAAVKEIMPSVDRFCDLLGSLPCNRARLRLRPFPRSTIRT
jgi:hypothetical protein